MRPARPVLGVVLIVGSVFLMSFGDALIKYNSASFTAWQIFVLRSLLVAPILLALMLMPCARRIHTAEIAAVGRLAQRAAGPDVDRLL